MQLPLLLAGPILRRVQPTLVSIFVALSQPANVRVTLWDGRVTAGSGNPWFSSAPTGSNTLRVGDKLHVVVATVKIPKTSPRLLMPGHVYSSDVELVTANGSQTLKSLGLLNTGEPGGKRVEALGFEENFLPSFALPPADLTQFRLVFGSCRRPVNDHLDAMVFIDDLMATQPNYDFRDPAKRPGTQRIRPALGEILATGCELLLRDEEVPREGVRVTRRYEMARWIGGKTYLWAGHRKQVGRGEGSSSLAFDRELPSGEPRP